MPEPENKKQDTTPSDVCWPPPLLTRVKWAFSLGVSVTSPQNFDVAKDLVLDSLKNGPLLSDQIRERLSLHFGRIKDSSFALLMGRLATNGSLHYETVPVQVGRYQLRTRKYSLGST